MGSSDQIADGLSSSLVKPKTFLFATLHWMLVLVHCTQGNVRLVGGESDLEGRLEIGYQDEWGTVCDDLFDDVSAGVVCASLGLGYAGQFVGNRFGAGSGRIWLDNVRCLGSEASINECRHNQWGVNDCQHSEDVSVSCYNSTDSTSTRNTTTAPSTIGSCGYQFACDNGGCIRYPYRCNGYRDCADGSDEESCFCDNRYNFQCDSGSCISRCYICDGSENCGDGSDERGCLCQSDQFSCDNGGCVSLTAKCNGIWECSDGSDEADCNCDVSQFKCSVGGTQCIELSKRCDGVFDCADSSDEFNCDTYRYCNDSGDFRCASGSQCVPPSARCDGVYDCLDHSDEFACNCTDAQFRCRNGQCIPSAQRCDQIAHCDDRTDEQGCLPVVKAGAPCRELSYRRQHQKQCGWARTPVTRRQKCTCCKRCKKCACCRISPLGNCCRGCSSCFCCNQC